MSQIKKLFILKEESISELPQGRKRAQFGVGWDSIPDELKAELDDDLIEYFELPPKERLKIYTKKFAFYKEGNKIHALYKEPGSNTEFVSVWNGKKWEHRSSDPDAERLKNPPDDVSIFGQDEDEKEDQAPGEVGDAPFSLPPEPEKVNKVNRPRFAPGTPYTTPAKHEYEKNKEKPGAEDPYDSKYSSPIGDSGLGSFYRIKKDKTAHHINPSSDNKSGVTDKEPNSKRQDNRRFRDMDLEKDDKS